MEGLVHARHCTECFPLECLSGNPDNPVSCGLSPSPLCTRTTEAEISCVRRKEHPVSKVADPGDKPGSISKAHALNCCSSLQGSTDTFLAQWPVKSDFGEGK